jgi:hypothetical protein
MHKYVYTQAECLVNKKIWPNFFLLICFNKENNGDAYNKFRDLVDLLAPVQPTVPCPSYICKIGNAYLCTIWHCKSDHPPGHSHIRVLQSSLHQHINSLDTALFYSV